VAGSSGSVLFQSASRP